MGKNNDRSLPDPNGRQISSEVLKAIRENQERTESPLPGKTELRAIPPASEESPAEDSDKTSHKTSHLGFFTSIVHEVLESTGIENPKLENVTIGNLALAVKGLSPDFLSSFVAGYSEWLENTTKLNEGQKAPNWVLAAWGKILEGVQAEPDFDINVKMWREMESFHDSHNFTPSLAKALEHYDDLHSIPRDENFQKMEKIFLLNALGNDLKLDVLRRLLRLKFKLSDASVVSTFPDSATGLHDHFKKHPEHEALGLVPLQYKEILPFAGEIKKVSDGFSKLKKT